MTACFAVQPPIAQANPERDPRARIDLLFSARYAELRALARRQLARRAAYAQQSTITLLHETYLVIAAREHLAFEDGARFLGYAARVMRGLIVDHTRRRHAQKRGGQARYAALDADIVDPAQAGLERLRVRDAVELLASIDRPLAELVALKVLRGFSCAEIAALRGTTERTVQRHWERARLFLYRALERTRRA